MKRKRDWLTFCGAGIVVMLAVHWQIPFWRWMTLTFIAFVTGVMDGLATSWSDVNEVKADD